MREAGALLVAGPCLGLSCCLEPLTAPLTAEQPSARAEDSRSHVYLPTVRSCPAARLVLAWASCLPELLFDGEAEELSPGRARVLLELHS